MRQTGAEEWWLWPSPKRRRSALASQFASTGNPPVMRAKPSAIEWFLQVNHPLRGQCPLNERRVRDLALALCRTPPPISSLSGGKRGGAGAGEGRLLRSTRPSAARITQSRDHNRS